MGIKLDYQPEHPGEPWNLVPLGYSIVRTSIGTLILTPVTVTATVAYVPPVRGTRRRVGLVARRRGQPSVPITAVVTVAVTYKPGPSRPQRRLVASRRRQSVAVPVTVTVTLTAAPGRPQRRLAALRRGRVSQTPTIAVTFVPPIERPQLRRTFGILRRRQPVLPNQTVVTAQVIYVPPITRQQRRMGWTRRRLQPTVTVTQIAETFPPLPPYTIRQRTQRFGLARRRLQPTSPLAQTAVVVTFTPPIAMARRRFVPTARHRSQPSVPGVAAVLDTPITPPRRRSLLPLRRRQQPVVPRLTVTVTVTYVPPTVRPRRWVGWLRRRPLPTVPPTQATPPPALPPLVPPFAAFLDIYTATTGGATEASTVVVQTVTSTGGATLATTLMVPIVTSAVDTTPRATTRNTTPQGETG